MTSIDDFKKSDGSIDWKALHRAEVNEGKKCLQCGGFANVLRPPGHPSKCPDCRKLDTTERTTHDCLVRCPHCRAIFDPIPDCDYYEFYRDGEHETYCNECEQEFTFTTHVSYSFESPEIK